MSISDSAVVVTAVATWVLALAAILYTRRGWEEQRKLTYRAHRRPCNHLDGLYDLRGEGEGAALKLRFDQPPLRSDDRHDPEQHVDYARSSNPLESSRIAKSAARFSASSWNTSPLMSRSNQASGVR